MAKRKRQATQWAKGKGQKRNNYLQSTTQTNKDQERTKINIEGHCVNIMMHKILKVVFVVFKYHNITSVDA
jgi:hypothetical protein